MAIVKGYSMIRIPNNCRTILYTTFSRLYCTFQTLILYYCYYYYYNNNNYYYYDYYYYSQLYRSQCAATYIESTFPRYYASRVNQANFHTTGKCFYSKQILAYSIILTSDLPET
jgi:hypothetical protein